MNRPEHHMVWEVTTFRRKLHMGQVGYYEISCSGCEVGATGPVYGEFTCEDAREIFSELHVVKEEWE